MARVTVVRTFAANGGALKLVGENHGAAFTVARGGKDIIGGVTLVRAQVVELRDSLNEVLGEPTYVEVACAACRAERREQHEQCEQCGGCGTVLRRA